MKKAISIFISVILLSLSLAACGEKPVSTPTVTTSGNSTNQSGKDLSKQDPYTVQILMTSTATTQVQEEVSQALSKIALEKFNTEIVLTRVPYATYTNQLLLMLSGGEKLDLFLGMGTGQLVNGGMIQPLDQLIKDNAPTIAADIGESDWLCTSINGEIYSVPNNKDKARNLAFFMRQDILDEINVKVEDIKNFDDLEAVLVKVKQAHPEMYPVTTNGSDMIVQYETDSLGSGHLGVLLDPLTSDSLKVENWYESDKYKELCERMYSWTQKGLVLPDGATNSEQGSSMVAAGKAFGFFLHSNPGSPAEHSISSQHELAMWEYSKPLSTTQTVNLGWCVPFSCEDPARAMQVLELLYTDPEFANIAAYGIEGKQWEFANKEAGVIKYPQGVDALNSGYHAIPWAWPNSGLCYVWDTEMTDLRQKMDDFNKTGYDSPAKGFTYNNATVMNEETACNNVVAKFDKALLAGSIDPKVAIPQFISELKENGMDKILAEKQRQLDEWAATNK